MMVSLARYRVTAQRMVVLGSLVLALVRTPTSGVAQECLDCVVYAATALNLRQNPTLEAPVLGIVPEGSLLHEDAGDETNGYVPVSVDGVLGWVIAIGLVAAPEEVGIGAATTAPAESPTISADARVTLAPLLLRSGPSLDADVILEMPEGAIVTLTWEGQENGYVTVELDGDIGWAAAEFLMSPSGAA